LNISIFSPLDGTNDCCCYHCCDYHVFFYC
jgi:hypothetical protein